ncbi:MAG: hypothetical protein KGH67_05045 [Candidatus Micrarchaeota archaeon]|nr:hypothetical protein [Candidatus Micrarchaeota archaeon]MDE1859866.1 hypothetical protein [Candidatus Micrarchaeota archaeon]
MPNNPGRIQGDYGMEGNTEINYIDPGDFGAVRKPKQWRGARLCAFAAALAIILLYILTR